MKRWLVPVALVALGAAPLRADVRVTSTTTIEGAFAGMMGGATPRVVMHVKGLKARADVDVGAQTISTITNVEEKEFILLNAAQKTAQIMTPGGQVPPGGMPLALPKMDATITPTGRSQAIAGVACEEFAVAMSMSMAEMTASAQMPPEAAEMMKSIRLAMNGSMWLAKSGPGVAEYMAYQAASTKGQMAAMMAAIPGLQGSGMDRLMSAFANADGLPYLTELTMTIEGNDQVAELMKQQGPIKVITKVTEVSVDPLPDDLFKVPEGYKILK
jgi:hypothetical protein